MRLDRGQFRAWLATKQPDEIVGLARDSCGCPLARFYNSQDGSEIALFADTMYGGYLVDRGYSKRAAPGWASDFIADVDGEPTMKISAARALEILEKVA